MSKKIIGHDAGVMKQVLLLKITNEMVADTGGDVAYSDVHGSVCCEYLADVHCVLFLYIQKSILNIHLDQTYSQ